MKKHIMAVVGTRPEAIKVCPLILELKKRPCFDVSVCATGQHRAMLDSVLRIFSIVPDFDFDVMRTGQSLSTLTARILNRADEILAAECPDLVLVQGDTATAFAASLAAFHRRIPIGHIEAGLRTYRMDAPYPEEFHRQAISLYATYHFAPTVTAKKNLLKEGRSDNSIFITGNTVVDALRYTLSKPIAPEEDWNLPLSKRIIVFTAHRRESMGEPIRGMLRALRRIVESNPDVIAVFPIHHNPEVRSAAKEILQDAERVYLIEPPDILHFHRLLAQSYLIMTDSGGIQEEAVALGIPTVVMRYSSERTEGLRCGVLRLAGSGEDGIVQLAQRLLEKGSEEYAAMKKPSPVYGDGNASVRIANMIEKLMLKA